MPLAKAVEQRFGELAVRKRGVSAAKNPVAPIRILERLELIPPTITELHRLQLQAIGKMAKAEDRPRVWATMADFQTLAEHRVHWAWARVFFAVGMAFTLCLRVSNVAVLRWGWLGHANWMVFFDYKVAKEMCAQPIPPITPEEVDSESDDDGMEDDEERPMDGDAEGHTTAQGPTTGVCNGDSDGVVAGERVLEHDAVAAAGG